MSSNYLLVIIILIAGMILAVIAKKLTVPAAITGGVVGFIIFMGLGYFGIVTLTTFFLLGTFATSWNSHAKERLNLAEENKGKRTTGQVVANAGVAAIIGLVSWLYPAKNTLFELMLAASFASATADTLSSELGNVYGRNFYNILTIKKDTRGLNGVVSFEGTIIGILGSAIIAIVYALYFNWNINALLIIVAGTIGNLCDSILGASFERNGSLNNNAVNFLNTFIAALVVFLLRLIL